MSNMIKSLDKSFIVRSLRITLLGLTTAGLLLSCSILLGASDDTAKVYDELETSGGESNAFGGTGASIVSGIAAVRINPAGLTNGRVYSLDVGYHRPAVGGDFYQIGIVDNKTSGIAAGFSYIGFKDGVETRLNEGADTPATKRFYLGFALKLNEIFSVGVGANYTGAVQRIVNQDTSISFEKQRSITALNVGALLELGALKLGLSAENVFKKGSRLEEINPLFYRFGSSYTFGENDLVLEVNLDYRGREAISKVEGMDKPEHIVFAGVSLVSFEIIKLMASYGQQVGEDRSLLGYGLSLMKNNSYVSASCLYPYFNKDKDKHFSLSLSYSVVI